MFGYEIEGLRRLGIQFKRWSGNARVKVRGRTGRMVYIGDLSKKSNRELVAKQYNVSMKHLENHLSANFKEDPIYRFSSDGRKISHGESHLYEHISAGEFYERLEQILSSQKRAFKFNVALGYRLQSKTDPNDRPYWHPRIGNTSVFDTPFAVSKKEDIARAISEIRILELADKLKYPSSHYQLEEITAFKVFIYFRNHRLGDSDALIPDIIKKNQHVLNFPKTNNKCVFFCVAYHQSTNAQKNYRRIHSEVKDVFIKYCKYKNIDYTTKLYKNFEPIDLMQCDDIEECFKVGINVFTMDTETGNVDITREASEGYDSIINILSHENHAMYIKDLDMFEKKFHCPKCEMIFKTADERNNHKRNRCNELYITSFVKEPTMYIPQENPVKKIIRKYRSHAYKDDIDYISDHFIVYDFESVLKPVNEEYGANTQLVNVHIPISVSIGTSYSSKAICIIDESPANLIKRMIEQFEIAVKKIQRYNITKFCYEFEEMIAIQKGEKYLEELQKEIAEEPDYLDLEDYILNYGDFEEEYKIEVGEGDNMKRKVGDVIKLRKQLMQIPILGFNSGGYDINLNKHELFAALGHKVKNVIKNPSYMCISTDNFKMLDIMNYCPAGTSLDSYLSTFLGGCKCDDKIQCTCGLTKGHFPYEYLTSFEVLNETKLPPQSAFDSKMKKTKIADADYKRLQFVWERYNMQTIRDLLIWYNNQDVLPFCKAIQKQKEFFMRFGLDMFADGVSLPGLSEKIMYQTAFQNLKNKPRIAAPGFDFPMNRFNGYRDQDLKADREFDMTYGRVNTVMHNQKYLCALCYSPLTADTASVDRISNDIGHTNDNFMVTCISCNVARKNMSISAFRQQKLLEYNSDKLVYSIDEEEKDIYDKMKNNIVGGPSIIFNRYAKRKETDIRGGKKCMKIIGYDANALYLWALGSEMPCGRLTTIEPYPEIIDDIMNDKIFGFVECDIITPEHLKDYFFEMTAIFKNVEIDPDDENVVDSHMYEYNQECKKKYREDKSTNFATKARKLIGSYFGKKILIYTPLLKWYLSHGMEITNIYSFIKCNGHRVFKNFMDQVSDARRAGNKDKTKKMIGDMMKLVGNSAFGRSGMDMTKHKNVKYVHSDEAAFKRKEHFTFYDMEDLGGAWEITMKKRTIRAKNPIHLSIAIYQLAKLRMLQFYYDCIDYYIDRSDFQYQEMDTDSAYIAFSSDKPFEECIKPHLAEEFTRRKYEWFPRDYDEKLCAYDQTTPGLFKKEWQGDAIVAISSKNYVCYMPDEEYKIDKDRWTVIENDEDKVRYFKLSAKGVQKRKNIDQLIPEKFETVIRDQITLKAVNSGFRICKKNKAIITYRQSKTGLNYHYNKRQVLSDGISTAPLPI